VTDLPPNSNQIPGEREIDREEETNYSREGQLFPHGHQLVPFVQSRFTSLYLIEFESSSQERDEALILQEEGDVVEGRNVVHGENLVVRDVTEHGDF
jgi:hypothetical protein